MSKRKAFQLKATNTKDLPRQFIFFDSESKVDVHIRDEDIKKLLKREADLSYDDELERVLKPHDPYLICATFLHTNHRGNSNRSKKVYVSSDFPECTDRNFCKSFWHDVDEYAALNEHLLLFAHNAGYDAQVTGAVHYLVRLGYVVTFFNDDNPFMMTLEKAFERSESTNEKYQRTRDGKLVDEKKKKTITIVSSTNFYAQSLKDLGKVFGLEKLDFKHDEDFDMDSAVTYCDRDVDILEKAMMTLISFVIREQLGGFKKTIASQAFAAFRNRFLKEHELYIHDDYEALATERRAYAGGRTECLRLLGKIPEKVYYVDVNSMYPHVMAKYLYPTKIVTRWNTTDPQKVKELIEEGYLVICDVYVELDKPMFHKKADRLIFPIGGFWTTLCTPEIIKGFNEGVIREVRNVCVYEPGNYFEGYVDYFYKKRLEAKKLKDKVHDLLYKLFLNTLYGKFGQRNEKWVEVGLADPEEVYTYVTYHSPTKRIVHTRVFGGKVWQKNEEDPEEAVHSFPGVAAHVTAYARMLLWEAIETAGLANVYYCDTDSLMTNEEGYRALEAAGLIDENELGKLKLEKIGTLMLYGCKDYRFILPVDSASVKRTTKAAQRKRVWGRVKLGRKRLFKAETKIKGVSKYAKPVAPTEDGKMRFAVTQWGGFSERLKNKSFATYYNEVIIKTLRREYNKGLVDGFEVVPFRFNEREDEKRAMREALQQEIQDLRVADYLKYICDSYGYIQTIRRGERFYEEYRSLPAAWKMRYFRKSGIPLDVWCEDNGKRVDELLTELKTKSIKRAG